MGAKTAYKSCLDCKHISIQDGCTNNNGDAQLEYKLKDINAAIICRYYSNKQANTQREPNKTIGVRGEQIFELEQERALRYLLAGKSEATFVSRRTGNGVSFSLTALKSKRAKMFSLNIKDIQREIYAGLIYREANTKKFKFDRGGQGRMSEDDTRVSLIVDVINNLISVGRDVRVRIYHSGNCGKCGRKLNDKSSIRNGLGPGCKKQLESR